MDNQTDGQSDRWTIRQMDKQTNGQIDRQTDDWTDRQMDRQTDGQISKQKTGCLKLCKGS